MRDIAQLKMVFDSFHEAIYIVDKNRKILYFNPRATEITGFEASETIGHYCYNNILNHVNDQGVNLCIEGCPLVESIKQNQVLDHMVYLLHKKGHRVKVHVRTIPYLEEGEVVGAIEVFTDETTRNLLIQEIEVLRKMNLIDPLTGLYHRRFLETALKEHISKYGNQNVGVVFIDLDYFKEVNDTYGHHAGDEVLKSVAKTLLFNLKQKDVVIRYGGDEMIALLMDVTQENAIQIAQSLWHLIFQSRPLREHQNISISSSIGVTMLGKDEDIMAAVDRADQAMYHAKKNGKGKIHVF